MEISFSLGAYLHYLAGKGGKVFGIDLSPSNASLAGQSFPALKLPGKVMTGDAENLPFANESFQVAFLMAYFTTPRIHAEPSAKSGKF